MPSAFLGLVLVFPFKVAEPLLPLAQFAPALLIGFGLTGRYEIDALRDDFHRRGGDIDRGSRKAALQAKSHQRQDEKGGAHVCNGRGNG